MFRKIKIGLLVLVGIAFLVASSNAVAPDVTGISVEALPGGDGVKILWTAVAPYSSGCWGKTEDPLYAVYLDDELIADSLTEPEYDLKTYGHEIQVTVFWGESESPGDEISVAPIAITTLTAWELNGEGASGIGFDVYAVATYMMSDSTNRDDIDCYFTDWAPGYQGTYSLAGADQVTLDPGGESFAATGWHKTLISEALDVANINDVEIVPAQGYGNVVDSVAVGATYAILTQDGYYGLIQVIEIDETHGEINIKATFQPIQGLRWM